MNAKVRDGLGSESKTHMARPRRLKEPVKLNLMIDKESKIKAMEIAAKRRMSVGRLFESWLMQELNGSQPNTEPSSES